MSDQHFIFDRLTASQALELLARTAEGTQGCGMEGVRVLLPAAGEVARNVTIQWPDPVAGRWSSADREQSKVALEAHARPAYKALTGLMSRPWTPQPLGEPLEPGAVALLLNGVGPVTAQVCSDEYLLVVRGKPLADVAQIADRLRGVATSVRWAPAAAVDGTEFWFMHLLDDPSRKGLLRGALFGQILGDHPALGCYTDGTSRGFLPQDVQPAAPAFAAFCRLVRAAPGIFGGAVGAGPGHNLLFAVVPAVSGAVGVPQLHTGYYLADLVFEEGVTLTPGAAIYASCEIVRLAPSRAGVDLLRKRIETAQPSVGYRLELRATSATVSISDELEAVEREISRLEYRRAYLETREQPRPRLLRFSQRQLPALADFIRCYPQDVLKEGRLLYGYQAGSYDPDEGVHYLFVPPDAKGMAELDPLRLWGHLGSQPMSFCLDPYWSPHYHAPGNESLVFVPEGTALFPPMHPWDEESVDGYLRESAARWFHGELDVAAIPAKPIYLFDGRPSPAEPIRLSVLDRDAFQPLKTRLGWLNDNLFPIHALEERSAFMEKLADDIARQELADAVAAQAAQAHKDFENIAAQASQGIAKEVHKLTTEVTDGIQALVDKTAETAKRIAELNKRVDTLKSELSGAATAVQRSEDLIKRADRQAAALHARNLRVSKDVDAAIAEANETNERVTTRVRREIDDLVEQTQRLRDEFYRQFGG